MNATNTPDYMTGAELQTLREACGLSREELAYIASVQARTVKFWETGKSKTGVPADVGAFVIKNDAYICREFEKAMKRHSGASFAVLLRTSDPVKNQVVNRVYMELRRRGQEVRIVTFDQAEYRSWLSGRPDTPANRDAWALLAVKDQARPHRTDQPT